MTDSAELSQLKRALVALKEMRARLDAVEKARTEPIAIIGMGCRFPGGANSPAAFWRLLQHGDNAVTVAPAARWDHEALYSPDPDAPGKMNTRYGAFLENVDQFDPYFFGITPLEAQYMDPQQRLLLEVTWEALENAGQDREKLAGSDTAVFVGVHSHSQDYYWMQLDDAAGLAAYTGTGTAHNVLSGRLSYLFDWQGPSVAIDTACSSSLVAIHEACQSLRLGEAGLALAAGVNLILSPQFSIAASKMRMLAPDGRCKVFDAAADGFGRGEGCGVVVLKRLSDAQTDGDPILAVIRGTAVNQDGKTNGLTAPNSLSQERVIRQALANARLEPQHISFIEAHGTGTILGDPIEIEALTAVLSTGSARPPCYLGSAKANIAHLEGAAGIAGLIKTVLTLQHRQMPPLAAFNKLNPHLSLADTPFRIPTEPTPLPDGGEPHRAGVSSFGWSGTNAHIIVEEAPAPGPATAAASARPYLLPLSAHTPAALRDTAVAFSTFLETTAASLNDICYTAAVRRTRHPYRLVASGEDKDAFRAQLNAYLQADPSADHYSGQPLGESQPGLVFVFPGQGAQWLGMGQELWQTEPRFRHTMQQVEAALAPFVDWSLTDQVLAAEADARLHEIDVVQPVLFAIQIALADLWRSWGFEPDAVVGHSMGEAAAAYVCGALSLEDAARVITQRSRLMRRVSGQGAMAVVGLSRQETAARLSDHEISIAVSNSPRTTVIAGNPAAIDTFLSGLQAEGVFCRRVNVDVASHSPQMDPLQADLIAALETIRPQATTIPLYSTVTGAVINGEALTPTYWADNLRQTVMFTDTVQTLINADHLAFIEISPHPILLNAIRETLDTVGQEGIAVHSLRRNQPEQTQMMAALSQLVAVGYEPDWQALFPAGGSPVILPNLPWQHESFWIHNKPDRRRRAGGRPSGHPLLGNRLSSPVVAFEAVLDADRLPADLRHQLGASPLLPAAGYLDALLAMTTAVTNEPAAHLQSLTLEKPLLLAEPQIVQWLQTGDALQLFTLQADDSWLRHATATLQATGKKANGFDVTDAQTRLQAQTPAAYARVLASQSLIFDQERPLPTALWQSRDEALARCAPGLPRQAAIDSAIQLLLATAVGFDLAAPLTDYLLTAADQVQAHGRYQPPTWLHVTAQPGIDNTLTGSLALLAEQGQPILSATGLTFTPIAAADLLPASSDDWFYGLVWEPAPLPEPANGAVAAAAPWLIMADAGDLGSQIAAQLQADGHQVTLLQPDESPAAVGQSSWRGVVYLRHLDATAVSLTDVLAVLQQTPAPLWLVTRFATPVTPDDLVQPAAAPLWGLGRTLALEQPARGGALIDIDDSQPVELAPHLVRELTASDDEDEIAYRQGRRLAARLQPQPPPPPATLSAKSDGCYLITGGLGSLGQRLATWLAAAGADHLVLTSRSGLPPRRDWDAMAPDSATGRRLAAVRTLEAQNTAVTVVRADSSDEAAMKALFARFGQDLPPLHGVVHAAGLTNAMPLSDMDPADADAILAPKTIGGWLLHQLSAGMDLDFFVLFSSAAAILGANELGHYAAANAYLDALAHYRRQQNLPALSINWGWWVGEGMATAKLADRFSQIGQNPMRTALALDALARLLHANATQTMVAAVDWSRFKPIYEAKRARPLLTKIAADDATAVAPTQIFVDELAALSPAQQRDRLRQHVREIAAAIMGFSADTLDPAAGFFAIGMDSVMAVQLRTRLEQSLGQKLPTTLAFEYPTVDKLTTYIYEEVLQPATAVTDPPNNEAPTQTEANAEVADDELLAMFDDELAAIDDLIDP